MSPTKSSQVDERGAVAVELVLLVPAVLLLVSLFVFGWRLWSARAAVLSAAEASARVATMSSRSQADANARSTTEQNLRLLGVHCQGMKVDADTTALAHPAGVPGRIRVDVTCTVAMRDLLVPGAPGSVTVTRSASEVVDTFAERRP